MGHEFLGGKIVIASAPVPGINNDQSLKVEMSQLMISRRQVGRSLTFKQNFLGSLKQTVEWHSLLKCVQLWTNISGLAKGVGQR